MDADQAQQTKVYRIPNFLSLDEIAAVHASARVLASESPASLASRGTLYDDTLPEDTW